MKTSSLLFITCSLTILYKYRYDGELRANNDRDVLLRDLTFLMYLWRGVGTIVKKQILSCDMRACPVFSIYWQKCDPLFPLSFVPQTQERGLSLLSFGLPELPHINFSSKAQDLYHGKPWEWKFPAPHCCHHHYCSQLRWLKLAPFPKPINSYWYC